MTQFTPCSVEFSLLSLKYSIFCYLLFIVTESTIMYLINETPSHLYSRQTAVYGTVGTEYSVTFVYVC